MGLIYCERCGGIFLPNGTRVKKAAVAQGPLLEVADSVCAKCMTYNEIRDPKTGEVITSDELRRRYSE